MRRSLFLIAFVVMALAVACHFDPSPSSSAPQRSEGDITFRLRLEGFHPAEPHP
jgi:hypothetical protein